MKDPFRYFNSSPEVIRLVVMMYVRYPLSLRNVEDLLAERGIDISHETVRFWWNRFGPMFAGQIRKTRMARMRGYPQWRWHLDEAFVKINGRLCYLWRAVDHEGEVLESVVTAKRDKAGGFEVLEAYYEEIWPAEERRHRQALLIPHSVERDRDDRSPRCWRSSQQSRREFASTLSTAREGHAADSEHEDSAEIQLSPRPGPQSFQSGAPPRQP
jgi:DDE domain